MNKKNVLLSLLAIILLFGSSQSVFANAVDCSLKLTERISEIDFSKEPTDEEKNVLREYYINDAKRIFNEEFAEKKLQEDLSMVNLELNQNKQSEFFVKEQTINSLAKSIRSASNLGTYGDILVTYSFSFFGIDVAAVGHAAIVHNNSNFTIESFPEGGVRVYGNDWRKKSKVYGVRVKGASIRDYRNAASYALKQANAKKPYNRNFFNKGTTDSFYCSQLVWRSWKNQGYEVDRMNLGNWEPVSPAELVGGSQTYVFYKK